MKRRRVELPTGSDCEILYEVFPFRRSWQDQQGAHVGIGSCRGLLGRHVRRGGGLSFFHFFLDDCSALSFILTVDEHGG